MTDPEVCEVAKDARASLMRAAEGRTRTGSSGDPTTAPSRPRAASYHDAISMTNKAEVFLFIPVYFFMKYFIIIPFAVN